MENLPIINDDSSNTSLAYKLKHHNHDTVYSKVDHNHSSYIGDIYVGNDGKLHKMTVGGADTVLPFNNGGLDTFTYTYKGYINPNNLNGGKQDVSFPISGYKTMEIKVTKYDSRNNFGSVTISGVGDYTIIGPNAFLQNGVKNISTSPTTVVIRTETPYNHEMTIEYSLIFKK